MVDKEALEQLQAECDSLESALKMANTVQHVSKSKLKDGYLMLHYANKILNKEIQVSDEIIDLLTENMYHYSDSLEVLHIPSKSNAIKISKDRKKKSSSKPKRKVIKKCKCK